MRIIIVGAGGHGQVVADALLRARECGAAIRPIGYVDDNPALTGQYRLGLPIVGRICDLTITDHDALVIAIGNNKTRCRLYSSLQQQGHSFATVCHPRAIVAPNVILGSGTVIFAGVVVNTGSVIGDNVILNTGCTVDHHNQIGNHVHLAPGVHLGGEVQIGEGTLVGIGATVMSQCTVGVWSTVGAGALVHRDLPARVTAYGVPAQIKRQIVFEREVA
jgi:sugar O-acyltransferase (sialic acid O-acetyltransferase NeuD family)